MKNFLSKCVLTLILTIITNGQEKDKIEKKVKRYSPFDRLDVCLRLIPPMYKENQNITEAMVYKLSNITGQKNAEEVNDLLVALLIVDCFDMATQDELEQLHETSDMGRPVNLSDYERFVKFADVAEMILLNETGKLDLYLTRVEQMNEIINRTPSPEGKLGLFGKNFREMKRSTKNIIGFSFLIIVVVVLIYMLKKLFPKNSKWKKEKKGKNYWCCCPFHGEKTASFSVSGSGSPFFNTIIEHFLHVNNAGGFPFF